MSNILVVDDEKSQAEIIKSILTTQGHRVGVCLSCREAMKKVAEEPYDLVLTDLKMPREDGLALLANLKKDYPQLGTVVMTAHGSIESAVEAMKLGAMDYLQKPFDSKELVLTLDKAFERLDLVRENLRLKEELATRYSIENIVGNHGRLQEVLKQIRKVAPTDATVFIRGESGTGKELAARAIHNLSRRKAGPFFPVNCAAIPNALMESELFGYEEGAFTGARHRKAGLFEQADQGTLFLDEICELDLSLQAKVLRFLQEKSLLRVGGVKPVNVDVRIIAATNQDAEERMAAGKFREDLYYRLNVVSFVLPPLRERKSDIPELAHYFIDKLNKALRTKVKGLSPESLEILMAYDWPGNVRQLESVVERALIMCERDVLTLEDLPPEVRAVPPGAGKLRLELPDEGLNLEDIEKELMVAAYKKAGGVISKAAALLGMSYKTFYYRWERISQETSLS